MDTIQQAARNGGPALIEAIKFVTAFRSRDPLGNYLHIGDLQWWCRDGSLDEQQNWHFWYQDNGETLALVSVPSSGAEKGVVRRSQRGKSIPWTPKKSSGNALGIIEDNEIFCLLHPDFRTHEHYLAVRQWGLQRLQEQARQQGEEQYEVVEEAASDEPERSRVLEREGYIRQESHYNNYHRSLVEPVPEPSLPAGFTMRSIAGEHEAEARAALQRDAFLPRGSTKTYEEGTLRQLAVMKMPYYDPRLDLMIIAPDGTPAAGCICWVDPVNRVGLFEPVGTRPQFRRQGLATALMLGGLQRLRERGMQTAQVLGRHPGDEEKNTEFTSSRFAFEAAGFQLQRRTYLYHKVFTMEA